MNVGQNLRAPVHQDRRGRRRASALRAADSLRRRRAARQRQDMHSRHAAASAGKFRPPVFGNAALLEFVPPAVPVRAHNTAPARHYAVFYFAVAVTSVLAAAMATSRTHVGVQRAHPSLIAIAPHGISRVVSAPQVASLRETAVREVANVPSAPPLAGLAALRETVQSRQVDAWLEPGTVVPNRRGDLGAEGDILRPEQADAAISSAIVDDEFGSGLKAPGICELPDGAQSAGVPGSAARTAGTVADAEIQQNQTRLSSNSATQVQPAGFGAALAAAAQRQTSEFTVYTDKYRRMSYPMGDVPALFGVCTDVVIRAYRALGIDLQALIHTARIGPADTSIAHRRTFTLRRYFASRGASIPISEFAEDYSPGDIVTYHRPQNRGSRDHIAIVSNLIAPSGRPMIVHTRGWGPQIEDALFVDKITGHYRYRGADGNRTLDASAGARLDPRASSAKPKLLPHKPRAAEAKGQPKSRSGKTEAPVVRR